MKAIVFDRCGDPGDVLQVRDVPVVDPGPGQVRVRMLASPINPSDLLFVRGEYGRQPKLPATPGFEGVGVIEAADAGLVDRIRGVRVGKRVAVPNSGGGNWQEFVTVSARQVLPVPSALSNEQAASFFVNPASALVMTRFVLRVPAGAWLLQTAAGSALGKMVISLGKHYGFRTINIIRRREQTEELRRLGADAVICTADEAIDERVQKLTGGTGVPFALDAVGGAIGLAAMKALGPSGRMLVYGTLSGEPMSLDPRQLMVNNTSVEGFWLSNWVRAQGVITMLKLFRGISRLQEAGVLTTDVTASFSLDQIQAAVRQASALGRTGKVILKIA